MTFAVGRISKCTLKLKLLVFLFCSPEAGLSYHVKCTDRSTPPPNLRVSENCPRVHFGDEVTSKCTKLLVGSVTALRLRVGKLVFHRSTAINLLLQHN